jgi:hypothetical protein
MNDKNIEITRYDTRAVDVFNDSNYVFSNNSQLYYLAGEKHYRKMLSDVSPGSKVLEIGAGMGGNTEFFVRMRLYCLCNGHIL